MMQALVHVGYGLMLCALVARDILWLRGTLVLAQGLLAVYAARLGVWSIAGWNVVFVLINSVWVVKILNERRAVTLPADLQPLYDRHFFALTPPEFQRWWHQGRREVIRDAQLATRGVVPDALVFILAGTVHVSRDHEHVADLSAGQFVGEMSLITGRPATADAAVVGEAEVMRWPLAHLHALRRRDPGIWTRIQSVIGQDLVAKISATSDRAEAG